MDALDIRVKAIVVFSYNIALILWSIYLLILNTRMQSNNDSENKFFNPMLKTNSIQA